MSEIGNRWGTKLPVFQPDPHTELEHERLREERAAAAQAFHAAAYREMPEDLRSRAKEWGVEALMNLVWMQAWECGYKQAERDRAAIQDSDKSESVR